MESKPNLEKQNDNILIVSDKFWDKIVCDIFKHFKYLSQVRPRPKATLFPSIGINKT